MSVYKDHLRQQSCEVKESKEQLVSPHNQLQLLHMQYCMAYAHYVSFSDFHFEQFLRLYRKQPCFAITQEPDLNFHGCIVSQMAENPQNRKCLFAHMQITHNFTYTLCGFSSCTLLFTNKQEVQVGNGTHKLWCHIYTG